MAELIGSRYRLVRKIGVGGMGEVYAARDERLERDVAVKMLTFFSGTQEQMDMFTARFKREAISMAQFIHPYIVPVYDFGEEDGRLYLVMGLMTGGSLKEKMGEPMRVREAVELILPVASALSYVHENGVIHRDVKPQNILFNQRGTPMLADFGIVKLMESEGVTLTATGTGVGTPAYMAPEQVTTDLDHRLDQYSLGVIFYELLTGKRPFEADTPVMTLIMHRTEPLPDPRKFVPDLSDEVCAVINKVLAKDREDRYANMDKFAEALRGLLSKQETRTVPAEPEELKPTEIFEEVIDEIVDRVEDPELLAEKPIPHVDLEDIPTRIASEPLIKPLEEAATELLHTEEEPTALDLEKAVKSINQEEEPTQINVEPQELGRIDPKNKKKFPVWIIPVALVVLLGIIAGVLALLGVGPFEHPEPTSVAFEYQGSDVGESFANQSEDTVEEEASEPEPVYEDNELSFAVWGSHLPLIEHLAQVFKEENPGISVHIENLSSEALASAMHDEYDFAMWGWMTDFEHDQFPAAQEYHIGYEAAFLNVHRELGIENLSSDEIYAILAGDIRNWAEVGGPDAEIIVAAAEGSFPWIIINYGLMGEQPLREDTVWLGSLEEVNEFVDSTWNAIGITGTRVEPEHILPLGVDGVPIDYYTLVRGEYPLEWANILVTNGDPDEIEGLFLEFVFSEEGWSSIWEASYVPWEMDLEGSDVPEEGELRIAGSFLLEELMQDEISRFAEQYPGWYLVYDNIGSEAAVIAVSEDEYDIAAAVYTSDETQTSFEDKTKFLMGWIPAFFFTHVDLDIWSLEWDQIVGILYGDITNWSEVGGPDQEIVIALAENTNAFIVVQYEMLDGNYPDGNLVWFDSSDAVSEFVAETPNAIGIVDNVYPSPDVIHWLRIGEVDTSLETIQSGEYPLHFPVIFNTKGEPSAEEWAFIEYLNSEEGRQAFWDHRIFPLE